jgi:hypothetical protein
MAERLGKVIYWAACFASALWLIFWIAALLTNFTTEGAVLLFGLSAIGGALVIWVAGRAVLYVLSGR